MPLDWLEQLLSNELGRPVSAASIPATGKVTSHADDKIDTVVHILLCAVADDDPEIAASAARALSGLKPVGKTKDAFASAPAFGAAVAALLRDSSLLGSVARIAVAHTDSGWTAAIDHAADGAERTTQYAPMNIAVALFRQGRERTFSRYELGGSIVRETIILPPLLWAISEALDDD